MHDVSSYFRRRTVDIALLQAYGFSCLGGQYRYTTTLLNGQFTMQVFITAEGNASSVLIDAATGDEYVLHNIASASGAFVGAVREASEQVLQDIACRCFRSAVFTSHQAKQVISYIRERYQHEPEFLWPRFPDNAIFRRSDNAKWYGAILTIKPASIGLSGDERIEILDLRMAPETLLQLTDRVKYFPGFHMNKKHWVTLLLDDTLDIGEICRRIDDSYQLACKK